MAGRPCFLTPAVAAAFSHPRVAASYRHRPAYPPATFAVLTGLIRDSPRAVLDLGCGTGFVARPLAPCADRIDAVDVSPAMIAVARRLPGGADPRIHWIVGPAERAPLRPPYALVTAGESLHWMDWEVLLPRLAAALAPNACLALLDLEIETAPEDPDLRAGVLALIRRFSTLDDWQPGFDLPRALADRGLVRAEGQTRTAPLAVRVPAAQYIESFHARAALAWGRLPAAGAAAFDTALLALLRARGCDAVDLRLRASIWWGRPLPA